jgi:hypothetical protein
MIVITLCDTNEYLLTGEQKKETKMKYRPILIITVLSMSLFGCSGDKKVEVPQVQTEPVLPPQDFRIQSTSWEANIDVDRMPQIIKSVYKKLDIVLKQQDEKLGRYIITGVSPAGFEVSVESISIIKDISFIRVSVGGRQEDIIIRKLLLNKIADAIRSAVRNQN